MLECPDCESLIHGTICQRCGWSLPAKKPVAEASREWVPPVYPDPPATPEQARAAIAKIQAMLAAKMTPP
jgi:hypothetical protein